MASRFSDWDSVLVTLSPKKKEVIVSFPADAGFGRFGSGTTGEPSYPGAPTTPPAPDGSEGTVPPDDALPGDIPPAETPPECQPQLCEAFELAVNSGVGADLFYGISSSANGMPWRTGGTRRDAAIILENLNGEPTSLEAWANNGYSSTELTQDSYRPCGGDQWYGFRPNSAFFFFPYDNMGQVGSSSSDTSPGTGSSTYGSTTASYNVWVYLDLSLMAANNQTLQLNVGPANIWTGNSRSAIGLPALRVAPSGDITFDSDFVGGVGSLLTGWWNFGYSHSGSVQPDRNNSNFDEWSGTHGYVITAPDGSRFTASSSFLNSGLTDAHAVFYNATSIAVGKPFVNLGVVGGTYGTGFLVLSASRGDPGPSALYALSRSFRAYDAPDYCEVLP